MRGIITNGNVAEVVLDELDILAGLLKDLKSRDSKIFYKIYHSLLRLRHNWRELSINAEQNNTLLQEHYNNLILDKKLQLFELNQRKMNIEYIIRDILNCIHPAFDTFVKQTSPDKIDTKCETLNEVFETTEEHLYNDLRERKVRKTEEEALNKRKESLTSQLQSLKKQREDIPRQFEGLSKHLENVKKYLLKMNILQRNPIDNLQDLPLPLKIIYIKFRIYIDSYTREDKDIIGLLIDEYGVISININKFIDNIQPKDNDYMNFNGDLYELPIRLEFSLMNSISSLEVVVASIYSSKNKLLSHSILADLCFPNDDGTLIPLIEDETLEITTKSEYGRAYIWVQALSNNSNIPSDYTNPKVDDIIRNIQKRLLIVSYSTYFIKLLIKSPEKAYNIMNLSIPLDIFRKSFRVLSKLPEWTSETEEIEIDIQICSFFIKAKISILGHGFFYSDTNNEISSLIEQINSLRIESFEGEFSINNIESITLVTKQIKVLLNSCLHKDQI
ncbi:hypothetical protein cand_007070 [Cryptosporidium andersoni]|uniref:Uncharacterized protein n=1 Tax=Cryptosporidium andersoni TaxID=117008 RepID=A0A1J4MPI6_9CRYT|nr:hypothetical protein cand_007070 [Cryptosporidium andersoni]